MKKTPQQRFSEMNETEQKSAIYGFVIIACAIILFISWIWPDSSQPPAKKAPMKAPVHYRTFTRADFIWDDNTILYRDIIVAGVNKAHREVPGCAVIDPQSAYIASSRGTPKNPVFWVTCGSGLKTFNYYFSKNDVKSSGKFKPVAHINSSRARKLCFDYVRAQAIHPSTVDFSIFSLSINNYPNGNTLVVTTFTAKNSFNLELNYKVKCMLDKNGLVDANIFETKK